MREIIDRDTLFRRVSGLLEAKPAAVIAIEGGSGSGKSHLAKQLADRFDGNLFRMDDFFLRKEQRTPSRLAEPGGNIDYERFKIEVLERIMGNETFSYRIYDCGIQDFSGCVTAAPKNLNIVEGVYSMHPYFGQSYDMKIVLEADMDLRLARIRGRCAAAGKEGLYKRYVEEWIPMEDRYFSEYDIWEQCDILFRPV